ncbi:MAG: diphosphate--fructose-6-phosphate 1-phosphotransferase, partial [Pseudobutyrivibrio sp.]|nr:diphosphate--fructose-6-phosphate 1-phosphotransferase [Pseudobutyrivibrio sp.]
MTGNVIVGQSGGPTAAINSSLAGVIRTAKDRGAGKIYGMLHGIKGLMEEDYIDLSDYIKNDLDVELLKRTPAAYLGSCRFKLPEIHEDMETYEKIFGILNKLEIEALIYIGGNDSMDTIKKLSDYAIITGSNIRFIGCPKTIDNDLALTDHTPGYGSAAKYIGTSVKEIIRDGHCLEYDKGLVTIVEIMGRNAGWLTGASILAKGEDCEGPDLIYLPEVPFDVEKFKERVEKLLKQQHSVVICVSEGIHTKDGKYVCELGSNVEFVDAFNHKQLTGTASYLCNYIGRELGCKTRAIELST